MSAPQPRKEYTEYALREMSVWTHSGYSFRPAVNSNQACNSADRRRQIVDTQPSHGPCGGSYPAGAVLRSGRKEVVVGEPASFSVSMAAIMIGRTYQQTLRLGLAGELGLFRDISGHWRITKDSVLRFIKQVTSGQADHKIGGGNAGPQ